MAKAARQGEVAMRKLMVSEFVSLDGVMQAPGSNDGDRDGGSHVAAGSLILARPDWEEVPSTLTGVDALLLERVHT